MQVPNSDEAFFFAAIRLLFIFFLNKFSYDIKNLFHLFED